MEIALAIWKSDFLKSHGIVSEKEQILVADANHNETMIFIRGRFLIDFSQRRVVGVFGRTVEGLMNTPCVFSRGFAFFSETKHSH